MLRRAGVVGLTNDLGSSGYRIEAEIKQMTQFHKFSRTRSLANHLSNSNVLLGFDAGTPCRPESRSCSGPLHKDEKQILIIGFS